MERKEKNAEIKNLAKGLASAQIALCADYRGLTVSEITTLRDELRNTGSKTKVVKNTLAKLALEKAYTDADAEQLKQFIEIFEGPSMLVLSEEDPVSPAKVIKKFLKDHKALEVKGGWFEGSFLNEDGVNSLASMPSREEALAKLLSLIAAPATQLVRLLQAPAQQLAQVLEGHRSNLESKGE